MNKVIVYYNNDGRQWGQAFMIEETEDDVSVVLKIENRSSIRFPKKLFSYAYLTESINVL
jgi:hypothetical protein